MNDITLKEDIKILHKYIKTNYRYDELTGEFFSFRYNRPVGCVNTCFCGKKYFRMQIKGKNYYIHRLAWLYVHGEFPPEQIDHINSDGLDNRLINLRAVSNSENGKNQRKHSTNVSGVMGVSWHKRDKRWQSSIKVDSKPIYLGSYISFNDAVIARKVAEKQYGFHLNHGITKPLPTLPDNKQ